MSHAFQALKYVIFFSRGFLVWFGFVLLGKPWEMEVKKERICLIQKKKTGEWTGIFRGKYLDLYLYKTKDKASGNLCTLELQQTFQRWQKLAPGVAT